MFSSPVPVTCDILKRKLQISFRLTIFKIIALLLVIPLQKKQQQSLRDLIVLPIMVAGRAKMHGRV